MNFKGIEFDEAGLISSVQEQRVAGLFKVGVADLESLRADQKYVMAKGAGREVMLEPALCSIEPLLPAGFIRVNRGVVVALSKITAVKEHENEAGGPRTTVFMAGGDAFDVSRRNRKAFRSAVKARNGGAQ